MLAGHNHGGQVRFPVLGSVLVPSRFSRRFDSGLFAKGPTVLHVSRGLAGTHPIRFRCYPEATQLILRPRRA
jgi:predicted MPP superfamily phosphohydrolase